MRTFISDLLLPYCDVKAVADGRSAYQELQDIEYDLVISDWMMPNMSGPELLDAMRAHPSTEDIPFIMLSARTGDESRLSGLLRGADGWSHLEIRNDYLRLIADYRIPYQAFQRQRATASNAHADPVLLASQAFDSRDGGAHKGSRGVTRVVPTAFRAASSWHSSL
jgi:CheY-like chemotaxis protein